MSAFNNHARHGLALTLCLFTLAGANAQTARPVDPLQHLTPQERKAFVQKQIARQQAERASAGAAAAADVTPPVLTKFNSSKVFDASNPMGPFKVAVSATDDLSGVYYIYAYAYGPNGRTLYMSAQPGYPAPSVSLSSGLDVYNWSDLMYGGNGAWKFYWAYTQDLAGNYAEYDETALAALGNTTITVVNAQAGVDGIAPSLTSGTVLTKAVSLSAYVPGTSQPPYVGIKLSATDTGTSFVSGPEGGNATFCQLAYPNQCIQLYGYIQATGQASATFTLGTSVSASWGNVPGVYELQHVRLWDHAANHSEWLSTKFGGSTDFSTMFPSTTIKLKP